VAGDFNCRIDNEEIDRGALLEDGLSAVGLQLMTPGAPPTYVDENHRETRSSTIDLVFTNIEDKLLSLRLEAEEDAAFKRKHRQVHTSWLLSSGNCGSK